LDINDLQNTLVTIYQKNINYFKKFNIGLFNKIQLLEQKNIENWYIDFVDNRFELSNINGAKIYNCDPFYDAKYRADNINSCPQISLINVSGINKGYNEYEDVLNAHESVNEILNQQNSNHINMDSRKFIFIGTILGVHINDIHRVKKADSYLIVEPNIEIFRLSLFLCDYTELMQVSNVFFCVDFNDIEFKKSIKDFLNYKYENNTFISFDLASENEAYLIEVINSEILNNSPMLYPFSEYVVSLKRSFRYIKESPYGILKLEKPIDLFDNKKVLFLGAGPSLSRNIEWIYLNQDNFIIVAASATLKRLELLGIIPDVIIIVDGSKNMLKQFDVSKKMYENSIILASVHIYTTVYTHIKNDKIFFIQDNLELFDECGISTGVTVGDSGIDLLLKTGCKELYLLGFDASLRDDGKTHDGLHTNAKHININTKKDMVSGMDYDRDIIWVKGNFKDEVPTTMLYKSMIDEIDVTLKKFPASKVYNLSNGAYFESTIPISIDNAVIGETIFDKNAIQQEILNILRTISKKDLTRLEISQFDRELKVSKKLSKINVPSNFKKEFEKIKQNFPKSLIIQIVEQYLKLTSPYVTYTQNHTIQYKQFLSLAKDLENALQDFMK
jgi:hypothetical protein